MQLRQWKKILERKKFHSDQYHWLVKPQTKLRLGIWFDEAAASCLIDQIPVVVHSIHGTTPACTLSLADWLSIMGHNLDPELVMQGELERLAQALTVVSAELSLAYSDRKHIHLQKYLAEAEVDAFGRIPTVCHRRSGSDEDWLATVKAHDFLGAARP